MPDNKEKKYTVDEIISEYDNVNAVTADDFAEEAAESEPAVNEPEQAGTEDAFAAKMSYESAGLFADGEVPENYVETEAEALENVSEDEPEEEIFEDDNDDLDDDDDDWDDDDEEFVEIDISDIDWGEFDGEKFEDDEPQTVEEMLLAESATWDMPDDVEFSFDGEQETVTETSHDNEIHAEEEKNDTDEAEEESPSEEAVQAEEHVENAEEDVNDKFLKRFLKGLLPWKGDGIGEIIRKIVFLAAVIVFVGAGIMLVSTLMQSDRAVEEKEENKSIIVTTVATTVDSEGNVVTVAPTKEEIAEHNFNVAEHFKGINEDYIGYLEVEGCDIAEPIMQCDDNDYYLTHTYYGGTNKAGTVFLDYRCTISEEYTSPNIVFYGHNQEDGTMFGNLKNYKQDVDFYAENPLIKFSPEFETGEYVIYGYFVTHVKPEQDSRGEVFHYHDYIETLKDEEVFNWYIEEIQKRNQIVSPVDVQFGDKLLCLSTCSNEFSDSRFVVFARRLRDGESIDDFDFSEAYLNPYAKGVDWDAIMSADTTLEESMDETEESVEESVEETADETAVSEETTVPEETTKKKKKETSDTRRSYKEYLAEMKTKTTTETTVTAEESDETDSGSDSVSDGSDSSDISAETSVSDGEAPAETSVPESAEAGEVTETGASS